MTQTFICINVFDINNNKKFTIHQITYYVSNIDELISFVFYCDYLSIKIITNNIKMYHKTYYDTLLKSIDLNDELLYKLLKNLNLSEQYMNHNEYKLELEN